jgi:hypothetical protein
MLRVITVALLLLASGGPATVQDRLAHPAVDLRGTLYRAVFVSAAGPLSDPDLAGLPDDLRARLSRFLIRQGAFERAASRSQTRVGSSSAQSSPSSSTTTPRR